MAEPRDLPLFKWSEARGRAVARRRRGIGIAVLAAAITPLGVSVAVPPTPRLVWNRSSSAPVGLYGVRPGAPVGRGDMVVAWTPEPWRGLAARRHYLPTNVPLVKAVAALEGDRVCAVGESLYVNGRWVALRRTHDGQGRSMPSWEGCATLGPGRFLLLMPNARDSFDGRYFGPVQSDQIIGKAVPLWVR